MPLSHPLSRPLSRSLSAPLTGVSGVFDPLDLSPVLLLDAAAGVYGDFQAPSLDINPAGTPVGPTPVCVRAGTATYQNEDGDIVDADPNTWREDWSLGYPAMLCEPSAVQSVGYTDFSSGWSENNVSVSAGSGYRGRESVVVTSTGAGGLYRTGISTLAVNTYTGRFYIRRLTTSDGVKLAHGSSASGNTAVIVVTEAWSLVDAQFLGEAADGTVNFGLYFGDSGDSVEIAMPQVEVGTVPTSFIPNTTGSPLTRNADVVSISGTDFTGIYNQAKGTVYVEAVGRVLEKTIACFSDGTADELIAASFGAASHLLVTDGAADQADIDAGLNVVDTLGRLAGTWMLNDVQCALDGAAGTPDVGATMPTVDRLHLGATFDGTAQLNGWIERLILWPKTPAELHADLTVLTNAATSAATLALIGTQAGDGDTVATWEDQSGNGNDATQTTESLQPLFVLADPSVEFDGADDHMTVTLGEEVTGTLVVGNDSETTAVDGTYSVGAFDFDAAGEVDGAVVGGKLFGLALFPSVLTASQKASMIAHFVAKGSTP